MKKWMRRLILACLSVAGAGMTGQTGETGRPVSWVLMRAGRADEVAPGAIAPESLGDVLELLYQGAAGETAAQMKTVLFPDETPEATEAAMVSRQPTLNGYRTVHALWCDAETKIVPAFEAKARESRGIHLGAWPDGSSREQRVAEINRWFGERTRGAVTRVIDEDALDEGTAFCGVLLAAFAAPWEGNIFAGGQTRPETFYVSAGERFEVPMMRGEPSLDYAEDDDFQFVRLPYAGSSIGLCLLLPKRAAEAAEAFAKADGQRWQALAAAAARRTVRLRLPKVNVKERIDWGARLGSAFGLDRPFSPGAADFSNLATHPDGPLYLRSLVQRVWVRWDERGTRAVAVTVYSGDPFGEAPEPAPVVPVAFVANHPFAYVIGDLAQGRVLFAGRIGRSEQMPQDEQK